MWIFRIVFFLLLVIGWGSPVRAAKKAEANQSQKRATLSAYEIPAWANWLQKYTASSPLIALRKTRPSNLQIRDQDIDSVLKDKTVIKFAEPLFLKNRKYTQYDLTQFNHSRRFEVQDQIALQLIDPKMEKKQLVKEEKRFQTIRDHMQQLVSHRKDHELLILFTGMTHAYDLYFSQFLTPDLEATNPLYRVRTQALYVGLPVTDDAFFYTQDYYNFIAKLRGTAFKPILFKENNLFDYMSFLARFYYYNNLKTGLVTKKELFKDKKQEPRSLVIMDVHGLNVPELFQQMPSPDSLAALGITQVKVAMEGWKYGKTYQSEEMRKFYFIKGDELVSKGEKNFFKKFIKKAFDLAEKGFVYNQTIQALHRKLQSYQASGIIVKYTGLEDTERF